jgi:multiple sugar transport system permease protein
MNKDSTFKSSLPIYLITTPLILGIFLISFLPTLLSVVTSFTDLQLGYKFEAHFIGLSNFIRALSNAAFLSSFRIGVVWSVTVTFISMFVGLSIALLILRNSFYSRALKYLVMIPWAMSPVTVAILWQLVLDPTSGLVNGFLRVVNFKNANISLLGDFSTALPTVIVVGAWVSLPVIAISYMASLKTINLETIEAAKIDGASENQILRYVKLPHLKGVTTALFVLNIIWNFNSFGLVYVLTSGGPGGLTYLPALFVYHQIFKFGNVGYAASMGVVITIILVILLGLYSAFRSRDEALK